MKRARLQAELYTKHAKARNAHLEMDDWIKPQQAMLRDRSFDEIAWVIEKVAEVLTDSGADPERIKAAVNAITDAIS